MNTEELREKMRQPLIDFAKEYSDIWPSYGSYSQFLERKKDCENRHIAQILKACEDAGLAFVVEDAELPIWDKKTQEQYRISFRGVEYKLLDSWLKEEGFKRVKEIEV